MKLTFSKLNGLGNDFIFIDNLKGEIELTDEDVRALCDRHFGIGADGIILVDASPRKECAAYMHYINADGTLAQMCGNGVRCFAKYLVDRAYVAPESGSFVADTLSGPKPITFTVGADKTMTDATVDMGEPILDARKVPINAPGIAIEGLSEDCVREVSIPSPWGDFTFSAVSMGNPHAICFIDDWESLPDALFEEGAKKSLQTLRLDDIGAFYESHEIFPEKANIEFAEVMPEGIAMRVYERGCGETLACGTGACATNVAARLTGRAPRENDLFLKGGTLHIVWADDGHIYMTGPAHESFTGEVEL